MLYPYFVCKILLDIKIKEENTIGMLENDNIAGIIKDDLFGEMPSQEEYDLYENQAQVRDTTHTEVSHPNKEDILDTKQSLSTDVEDQHQVVHQDEDLDKLLTEMDNIVSDVPQTMQTDFLQNMIQECFLENTADATPDLSLDINDTTTLVVNVAVNDNFFWAHCVDKVSINITDNHN